MESDKLAPQDQSLPVTGRKRKGLSKPKTTQSNSQSIIQTAGEIAELEARRTGETLNAIVQHKSNLEATMFDGFVAQMQSDRESFHGELQAIRDELKAEFEEHQEQLKKLGV